MQIIFNSINNPNDKRTLHTKTKNIEITTNSNTNEIINELINQIIQNHKNLSKSLKNNNLTPEDVESINYNFNQVIKISSYIESPEWLKNKKCTINPQNKNDNSCFQHAITVALNYKKIDHHPERILKIMSFINQYN